MPISGGLDSRSLAASIKDYDNVFSYSYEFEDGINETEYGEKIAKKFNWPFSKLIVKNGYLWNNIDYLADINGCYSDFTQARQFAFMEEYKNMGEIFFLGHWGDVLFDNSNVSDDISFDELVLILKKKIVKKGGLEIGKRLWEGWGLEGDFEEELTTELSNLLEKIKIDNNNARLRAFKSLY